MMTESIDEEIIDAPPAPSWRTAGLVSLGVFFLYLATLAPTIGLWDAGEYIAAAARMGVPHPPGNPGFVLLGRVASMLPLAPTVAMRLNVLVALASAISSGLWFLIAEHVARHFLGLTHARVAGIAAAVLGATMFTVWNQSVVNEKVYTLSLFLLVLDVWTALQWQQDPDGPRADRRLALICYRLGLGYTIHIAGLLAGPAVLAAVLTTRPETLRRTRFMLMCGALFMLGFTPFAALPIRSAFRLEINEGHPTACEDGVPHLGCTFSATTVDRFMYEHNRTQYAKPPLTERQESIVNQVRMWWLYFKWQPFRDAMQKSPEAQSALATLMLLFAGLGGWAHRRHDPRTFVPFATLVATITIGLIFYLNFKLGYTQALLMNAPAGAPQEVRDRDYFYLWGFSALAVWMGLGIAYAWRSIAIFFAGTDDADEPSATGEPAPLYWRRASVVLLIALVPLALNAKAASRRGETFPEDFAIDMLNSVEPNGVLFTGGDNDSFPLWFAQQVLGVRRDVSVVLIAYLSTDWYVRELITRKAEPYDAKAGPAIYRDFPARTPRLPLINLTRDDADSIPGVIELREERRIALPGFDVTLPPSSVPRDILVMLRIIHDAGAERPIHFSRGAGSDAIDLLFRPHFVMQGLTHKLVPDPATAPGAVATKQDGYVDLPRTQALWAASRSRPSLVRQNSWIDEPSANIPFSLVRVGSVLAEAQVAKGKLADADVTRMQIKQLGDAMSISRFMRSSQPMLERPAGLGYAPVSTR